MKIPEMMDAVVLVAPGQTAYKQIPVPALESGWVLMKVEAVSVCGSDVMRVSRSRAGRLPMVLGHECAGTVVSIGEGVDEALLGRRVALIPLIPNWDSPISKMGYHSSSPNYGFIGSRINGCLAEYVALPAENAIELPDEVSMEFGSMLEPCTVGYHALRRGGGVVGKSVAVFGVGSIGLLTIQVAKVLGASQIIAIDISDYNLKAAAKFGAHVTINAREVDVIETIMEVTECGVDMTLEVAGQPETLEQSILATHAGGDVVLVGLQPVQKQISLNVIEQFMNRQLNMHGSWMSYSAPFPGMEWQGVLDMMMQNQLLLEEMITQRVLLEELPAVFEKIDQGALEYLKILVFPNG